MPKTKPPITITSEEFKADPGKWVMVSGERRVDILDSSGNVGMRIGGLVGHTHRVKHKYPYELDDPKKLSELRDYYSDLYEKDRSEHFHLIIELIENLASYTMGNNLDDISDREGYTIK